MSRRQAYLLYFLTILFIFLSNLPLGFCFVVNQTSSGKDIKWANPSVTYYINLSGGPTGSLAALQASMQTWANVSTSSFSFIYGGITSNTAYGVDDGINLMCFGPMGSSGWIAENRFWFYPNTGYIIESDIKFNTNYLFSTTGSPNALDLESVALHELGHSLSLDDLTNSIDSEKIMFYLIYVGEIKRALHQDDQDGITYLYPFVCPTPAIPSNPSPSNGATSIAVALNLNWISSNADSYDVYFGTSPNPPYLDNTVDTNYPIFELSTNTTYYWKIVAKNNCGNSTQGPIWSFATMKSSLKPDFDGDEKSDLFWRHASTGQTAVWLMDGTSYSSHSPGTVSDLNWQIKGMGDFDGNGKTDIFWQDTSTGWTMIWFMNGTTLSSQQSIAQIGLSWQIKGIGDFDGDGKADVLWQDTISGWTAIWFMDGATVTSTGAPAKVDDPGWQIKEVADFNGDGKADILWLNTTSGWTYIWLMDGATITSGAAPAIVGDSNWQIKEVGDFNGDGKTDILWLHMTSGWTYIWLMNGATITSGAAPAQVEDADWQIKCVGDFDGNGKADVFWQHTTTGWTYIWFMEGGTIVSDGIPGVVGDMNWQIMN